MKTLLTTTLVLGYFSLGNCFTKYGRSCKDIGCPSTQQCVMESEPCSFGKRQNECGAYPTCKRLSNSARTCSNFVCPPGQNCQMDGETPKCVDGHNKAYIGYDTKNAADNRKGTEEGSFGGASAPVVPPSNSNSGNLYPSVPKGETTSRPNINRPYSSGGNGGYQGGHIGSGYPGQPAAGYPGQPAAGYPGQPAAGNPGQPAAGYPGQPAAGYPGQPAYGGYPQGGGYQGQYSQGGYSQYPQGGYPQGGGYNQYPQGGYPYQQKPPNSGSSSITDKIGSALKSIGTDWLKSYLTKAISGNKN